MYAISVFYIKTEMRRIFWDIHNAFLWKCRKHNEMKVLLGLFRFLITRKCRKHNRTSITQHVLLDFCGSPTTSVRLLSSCSSNGDGDVIMGVIQILYYQTLVEATRSPWSLNPSTMQFFIYTFRRFKNLYNSPNTINGGLVSALCPWPPNNKKPSYIFLHWKTDLVVSWSMHANLVYEYWWHWFYLKLVVVNKTINWEK